jgi:hypothetical protein
MARWQLPFRNTSRHATLPRMSDQKDDDQYSDEETKRRAREAIRRSFEIPHKTQKEMVGKVGAPNRGRPKRRSRPVDEGKDQA